MIDSKKLLTDLQSKSTSRTTMVKRLEDDLRKRCDAEPAVNAPLKERYDAAKAKKRTALTYKAWRDEELTQIAVAWVLGCVFVRFLEDNGLVETPKLSGPGERLRRARDEHELFIQRHPLGTEREFLLEVFEETGRLPGMKEFFDKRHNPLWLAAPSGDACRELWLFWQKTDPVTGDLLHDFTDPSFFPNSPNPKSEIHNPKSLDTRFLGDLYQDLSEAARKKYALLQTPDFVEEFILDRTLTPAIETFGYREVRMIDPTCGSGHFCLGGFGRIFRLWQQENPEENPRILAQRALDAVCGVDLNPFAVAIARFRLLLAALQVCGVKRLVDAPDFRISLAVGDSLIHGARFDSKGQPYVLERQTLFGGEEAAFKDEVAHFFDTEDSAELHRILGRQYHAVVGNPPYITVKDKALNELYRQRYDSCSGKYALSVPFMERFFDLALSGSGDGRGPAGFTGQITSNSFMKRSFGKKLIEEFIPRWDLTHVIDSDKAFIPGHATPTVILFGRNRSPQGSTVRTVMGIRKEIPAPEVPAKGKAWGAIVDQVDRSGSESEFVSAADTERGNFHEHPWSIGGGGAAALVEEIEARSKRKLGEIVDQLRGKPNIGITAFTLEDDLFLQPGEVLKRHRIEKILQCEMGEGDTIRDWLVDENIRTVWPYDSDYKVVPIKHNPSLHHFMWVGRTSLSNSRMFGAKTKTEAGLAWHEFGRLTAHKLKTPLSITFAFVGTHNHFVLDRGGKVFKQSVLVIKLPPGATEDDHLQLVGYLNSASGCFFMKQVFHDKGAGGIGGGIASEQWEHRFEFDGTKIKQFPISAGSPLTLARELDRLAREMSEHSPSALTTRDAVTACALAEAAKTAIDLRAHVISLQEELDWQCYRHYGLIETADNLEWPEDDLDALPALTLGQRTFEIRMARQMAAGELETTWFERHKEAGSKPITELPASWPDDYRTLVERRLAFIEANKNINLIERPEYKRRWNTEPWAKRQQSALRKWLLARLEGYFFEGSRVCDLGDSFDPASKGFRAALGPHLVTANQLADVVSSDTKFLEAAEVYEGASGFSVPKLIRTLVDAESVPYLPVHRYKESGLRKRHDWETTWDLQRKEDEVEEGVRSQNRAERDRLKRSDSPEGERAEARINSGVSEEELKKKIHKAQQAEVGDIAVPPKYAGADFAKASYWKLRGKLDVPKERWISYPGAERAGDDSLVVAWAGWDHLQQAQALAEYTLDAKDNQGWPADRLKPLLAGLSDLIPWLKQWHNTPDPNLGMGLGDYFAGFLEEQCRGMGMTVEEVDKARFEWETKS